jgi:hypothetical protein
VVSNESIFYLEITGVCVSQVGLWYQKPRVVRGNHNKMEEVTRESTGGWMLVACVSFFFFLSDRKSGP